MNYAKGFCVKLMEFYSQWKKVNHFTKIGYIGSLCGIVGLLIGILTLDIGIFNSSKVINEEYKTYPLEPRFDSSQREDCLLISTEESPGLASPDYEYINLFLLMKTLCSGTFEWDGLEKLPVMWSEEGVHWNNKYHCGAVNGTFYAKVDEGLIPCRFKGKVVPAKWEITALGQDYIHTMLSVFDAFLISSPRVASDAVRVTHADYLLSSLNSKNIKYDLLYKYDSVASDSVALRINDYIVWSECAHGGSNCVQSCQILIAAEYRVKLPTDLQCWSEFRYNWEKDVCQKK